MEKISCSCHLCARRAPASGRPAAATNRGRLAAQGVAHLSGLPVRRVVPTAAVAAARYDAALRARTSANTRRRPAADRHRPVRTARADDRKTPACESRTKEHASRAWYDPLRASCSCGDRRTHSGGTCCTSSSARSSTRTSTCGASAGCAAHDRDKRDRGDRASSTGRLRWRPAFVQVPCPARRSNAFSRSRASRASAPGEALASELRYLGGRNALATACSTFPQTTEQLLHIDKFLERERALPGPPARADRAVRAEHLRDLRRARRPQPSCARSSCRMRPRRPRVGAAGRVALYVSPQGERVVALVLRWDTSRGRRRVARLRCRDTSQRRSQARLRLTARRSIAAGRRRPSTRQAPSPRLGCSPAGRAPAASRQTSSADKAKAQVEP